MNKALGIAIYVVIWWTVLFAVLPLGVRTQEEDGVIVPGTPSSAPTRPRLLRIVLLTTAITTVLFGGIWIADAMNIIDAGSWIGRPH